MIRGRGTCSTCQLTQLTYHACTTFIEIYSLIWYVHVPNRYQRPFCVVNFFNFSISMSQCTTQLGTISDLFYPPPKNVLQILLQNQFCLVGLWPFNSLLGLWQCCVHDSSQLLKMTRLFKFLLAMTQQFLGTPHFIRKLINTSQNQPTIITSNYIIAGNGRILSVYEYQVVIFV